jgi:hypothetical protein
MQETPGVAQLEKLLSPATIAQLAGLYDRAANSLDPFSTDAREAERLLGVEMRQLYDCLPVLPPPGIEFRTFRRFVIDRCRKYLRASDRPGST